MARARAYDLFADLILDGPTEEVMAKLTSVPELAELVAGQDDETRGAAHYALFGLAVYPFANVYLGDDGLAGGVAADRLGELYVRLGFRPSKDAPTPDHLSAILEALAFAVVSEVEHLRHGATAAAARWRVAQAELLDEHLLSWVPMQTLAVRRHGDPFYGASLDLLLEVLVEHRRMLAEDVSLPGGDVSPQGTPDSRPAKELDLDDPSTSLGDIARYLLTPARSGLVLSRTDLAKLARQDALPRGFGDRQTELENLLHAAAQYDALPALTDGLKELIDWWTVALGGMDAQVAPGSRRWLDRLQATRALGSRLAAAATRRP